MVLFFQQWCCFSNIIVLQRSSEYWYSHMFLSLQFKGFFFWSVSCLSFVPSIKTNALTRLNHWFWTIITLAVDIGNFPSYPKFKLILVNPDNPIIKFDSHQVPYLWKQNNSVYLETFYNPIRYPPINLNHTTLKIYKLQRLVRQKIPFGSATRNHKHG